MIKKYVMYLTDPIKLIVSLGEHGYVFRNNDALFLKIKYMYKTGKRLHLEKPVTFNEKMQWLKLYDRRIEYSAMADKCEAKRIVESILGAEYIVPTYGVWDSLDDIDWNSLPDKYVLKCTHNSGVVVICKNKNEFSVESCRRILNQALKTNYFYLGREWPYKFIKPRIIAEELLEDGAAEGIYDYKFFCFDGKPEFVCLSCGLHDHSTAKMVFLSCDWEKVDISRNDFEEFDDLPPKPSNLEEMISVAKRLSEGYTFIRIDLYSIKGKIYFSEYTLYPCGGMIPFYNDLQDQKLGELISLENVHVN